MQKLSTSEFVAKAKLVHGNKFGYKKVNYEKTTIKVTITCKKHGDFLQSPLSHLMGRGCTKCKYEAVSTALKDTLESFLRKAKCIHGDTYDYSKVKYKSSGTKVTIICKEHGKFQRCPGDHINQKSGCPKCAHISRKLKLSKTTEAFVKEAKSYWSASTTYERCKYVNSKTKVNVTCKQHGDFLISPRTHLKSNGCPQCRSTRFSQMAINWINKYAKENRIVIHHANNGGEFYIPETKYRVDGFNKRTNTVFEFYGDRFHGNLKRFSPLDHPHPFNSKVTTKELYDKTMKREQKLRKLGYTVVSIWESEYNLIKNKSRCGAS